MFLRLGFTLFPLLAMAATHAASADWEFTPLAATPYPSQHANPRNSDYTPYTGQLDAVISMVTDRAEELLREPSAP